MKCEICGRDFKNINSLSKHIRRGHKITLKEYHNNHLRKDINEGKCLGINHLGIKCEKETMYTGLVGGYRKFCSRKCMANNKAIQEKRKQTEQELNIKNSDRPKKIQDKKENTWMTNFGYDNPSKSPIVKEKKIKTNQKNYGKDYFIQTDQGKEKIKKGFFDHYGIDHWTKTIKGREVCRLNRIKFLESLFPNGQKMKCNKGKNETEILDELEYDDIKLSRDLSIGGLYPDGLEEYYLVAVEYDEKWHLHSWAKAHDKVKDEYYISKGYMPIHIKESDWFEDKELQIIKLQETIKFLEQVQLMNLK